MFAESDLLPISALQHMIFCERQCALIHNEQLWAENRLTIQGQQLHQKAHDARRAESRPGVRITRGLPLRSFTHGLIGQADVVEFHTPVTTGPDEPPDHPPNPDSVLPIEYKRGRPKAHNADRVQLCAQAFCLEELLRLTGPIPAGRLFYGKTRRRQDVPFDASLREQTRRAIQRLHALIGSRKTPPAQYEPHKCDRCSLIHLCMPKQLKARRSAEDRFLSSLAASLGHPEPGAV